MYQSLSVIFWVLALFVEFKITNFDNFSYSNIIFRIYFINCSSYFYRKLYILVFFCCIILDVCIKNSYDTVEVNGIQDLSLDKPLLF